MRCLNCMKEFEESYGVCPHCGYVPGADPKEPFQLRPGVKLAGRYLIGTAVGVGGFGITYRAWDERLNQVIAVKEYYPSANGIVNRNPGEEKVIVYSGARRTEFEKGKQRFLSEARNMAKFSTHPNIVHVYDFFEANGTAYITMEFLDGISYKQFIASNEGRIPVETARNVTLSVLDALREIHKVGIIHRDISPDNIFITNDGIIKLIDFGAARFSTGEEEKTLSVILKPGYAPPEQYRSRSRQGPWTDIYAVGAMFFRAVTGRMPDESVNRMVKDEMPSPRELNQEVPENINNAIMRAMAVNQELRFKNVDQFAEAIKNPIPVRGVEEELSRRKGMRIGGILVGLGIAAAIGGFGVHSYLRRAHANDLAPAGIVVWYPYSGEEVRTWTDGSWDTAPDEADAGFEEIFETFKAVESNAAVSVTAVAMPETVYAEALRSAIDQGSAPTVFDSTFLSAEYNDKLAPLDETIGLMDMSQYWILDRYETLFPQHKHLPLTFSVPVVYANPVLAEDHPAEITSAADLQKVTEADCGYAVSEELYDRWNASFQGLSGKNGYDSFLKNTLTKEQEALPYEEQSDIMLDGKVGYYLSDSSEYVKIQKDMAGLYTPVLVTAPEAELALTNVWSVSAAAAPEEQRAGMRLLYFMLSDKDQQTISIQNGLGLPVHKGALTAYEEINTEFAGVERCAGTLGVTAPWEQ